MSGVRAAGAIAGKEVEIHCARCPGVGKMLSTQRKCMNVLTWGDLVREERTEGCGLTKMEAATAPTY